MYVNIIMFVFVEKDCGVRDWNNWTNAKVTNRDHSSS